MAVHKRFTRAGIYFITFTCYKWHDLIRRTNSYDVVLNFFSHLNSKGHQVLGYTIMPNHVHLLAILKGDARSFNTVIGTGKRFIGYEIIKRLQLQDDKATLSLLADAVTAAERKRRQLHQLWQGSFDIKECRTEKFILQKLNYMHQNPCVERWQLCQNTYDYPHSSAAFYEMGKPEDVLVRDYRDYLATLLELYEETECSDESRGRC